MLQLQINTVIFIALKIFYPGSGGRRAVLLLLLDVVVAVVVSCFVLFSFLFIPRRTFFFPISLAKWSSSLSKWHECILCVLCIVHDTVHTRYVSGQHTIL